MLNREGDSFRPTWCGGNKALGLGIRPTLWAGSVTYPAPMAGGGGVMPPLVAPGAPGCGDGFMDSLAGLGPSRPWQSERAPRERVNPNVMLAPWFDFALHVSGNEPAHLH